MADTTRESVDPHADEIDDDDLAEWDPMPDDLQAADHLDETDDDPMDGPAPTG